jgi:hypothetical protein
MNDLSLYKVPKSIYNVEVIFKEMKNSDGHELILT